VSAALLHGDGWDELVMVVVGLLVAWAVIALTGRRTEQDDEEGPAPGDGKTPPSPSGRGSG